MNSEVKKINIMVTAEDKAELDKLDKWGGFLNDLMDISNKSLVLGDICLIGAILHTMLSQSVHWVKGVVVGLVCFIHPWVVWAIKFMGIHTNGFEIPDLLLIVTGIYLGMYYINGFIDCFIEKANRDVEDILSKYTEEENNNE